MRPRVRYLLAAPAVFALGLASRLPAAPELIRTWAGDPLYAVLIYVLVRFLAPGSHLLGSALVAWLTCVAVEVSQLWHPAWLDAVRATRLGALVLGRGFLWSDLAAYAVGVALALGVDRYTRPATDPPRAA